METNNQSTREIKLPSFVWALLCPVTIIDPNGVHALLASLSSPNKETSDEWE